MIKNGKLFLGWGQPPLDLSKDTVTFDEADYLISRDEIDPLDPPTTLVIAPTENPPMALFWGAPQVASPSLPEDCFMAWVWDLPSAIEVVLPVACTQAWIWNLPRLERIRAIRSAVVFLDGEIIDPDHPLRRA